LKFVVFSVLKKYKILHVQNLKVNFMQTELLNILA